MPYDPWFSVLKHRWKRSPGTRDEIRVACHELLGNEPRKVIGWLECGDLSRVPPRGLAGGSVRQECGRSVRPRPSI